MAASSIASSIAAALANGTATERESAYATIEGVVRGVGSEEVVALAVACVKPLIVSVLCAPASRIAVTECHLHARVRYGHPQLVSCTPRLLLPLAC